MADPVPMAKEIAFRPGIKAWWIFHLIVSALPLTWAVLMCVYAFHVRTSLGHWPHPMVESGPRDVLTRFLDSNSDNLILVNLPAFVVWCVLSIWLGRYYTLRQYRWQIGLYVIGVVACLVFIWANPGKFMDWWLD